LDLSRHMETADLNVFRLTTEPTASAWREGFEFPNPR
jgi:hypothetical protein